MIGNFEPIRPDLNLPSDVANYSDLSAIVSIFLCITGFQHNSTTEFLGLSYWLNGIAEKYIFPIHHIVNSEPQFDETIYSESKQNARFLHHEGKYRFVFSLNCDYQYGQDLKKYSGQALKVYFADINGNLYGKLNGAAVEPFETDLIHVSKPVFGSINPGYTNITVDITNSKDLESAYIDKPTWDIEDAVNIEVEITDIILEASDTMSFKVTAPGDVAINGLLSTDFVITDNITGLKTCVSLVNTDNGEYTFESNENFYAGQIKLKSSNYHALATYALATIPQYKASQYNNTQYKV